MKPAAIIPIIGCILLGAAFVLKSRTASVGLSEAAENYRKLSNDWHQAVFKLDEQSRLSYTLQTGLKILTQEHLAATNELSALRSGLRLLQSNHIALLESSMASSNQFRLKVLELEDEQADSRQRLAQADLGRREAIHSLAAVKQSLDKAIQERTSRSNRITQLEMAIRTLEARWADPALLRAQWQIQDKAAKADSNSAVKAGRLALQPDGSVRVIPR